MDELKSMADVWKYSDGAKILRKREIVSQYRIYFKKIEVMYVNAYEALRDAEKKPVNKYSVIDID